ncbi:MAG: hypothetical protein R3C97_01575 [Geminicoccaceae bacterium]
MSSMDGGRSGWSWFENREDTQSENDGLRDLFEATFATRPGRIVLAHLRQLFIERRVPPSATDAELRHVEGARAAIAYIERLAASARKPKDGDVRTSGDLA